jgi:predicted nucleotidyltransferase
LTDIDFVLFDPEAAVEGVWFKFEEDFELKIASSSTKEYDEANALILEKKSALFKEDEKAAFESMQVDLAVDVLVKDWRGLTRKGEPVPFSKEELRKMLSHPGARRVLEFVVRKASSPARFRATALQEARKNSQPV